MTRAYQEIYLNNAQSVLGEAFDYAINDCKIPGPDFVNMFMSSSVSKRMESGEPAILAGKSGIDLVFDIVLETSGDTIDAQARQSDTRSKEYWIGWSVAYYQWYTSRSYAEIFAALPYDDLEKIYYTLHEADISKFVETADDRIHDYYKDTNLKRIRLTYGCSQAVLSKLSGVMLRSIQMYEQRRKDINKASAETVYMLSKALGCTVEDLLEK